KCAALALVAVHPHGAAVSVNQFLHQSQTDYGSLVRAGPRPLHPVKPIKQIRQLSRWDPDPSVSHREFDLIIRPSERNTNTAPEGVFQSVAEKVDNDLLPH